jgi:hypothetical protein
MPLGPTRLTHGTGPSRKLSTIACRHVTMVLPNSYWNVWQCGRSDTPYGVSIIPPYETYILYEVYITPGLMLLIQLFNGMQSSLSMVYDREMGNTRARCS